MHPRKLHALESELKALRDCETTDWMFYLNIAPKPYQRIRVSRRHAYNTPKYTQYKNHLKFLMREARGAQALLTDPIGLNLYFFMPGTRHIHHVKRPDLDNLLKPVLDCGNGIIWKDDCQIVKLSAYKAYGDPKIIIAGQKI